MKPRQNYEDVSILLVVELAFEVRQGAPDVWRQLVSILLVVELAFEEALLLLTALPDVVSILLVVELAFEVATYSPGNLKKSSFNPSCSGIGF